ncbi:MAG: methylenetetrahydrofolate reductase [Desulfovibrionales bacterium]|nr:methylenetetrahydrofolate reductase [Desulfovibrionales bacterium]
MTRSFREALDSGRFLVTVEIAPPKGTDVGMVMSAIKDVKDVVDAVGVADNPGAVMTMSPWALCRVLAESGGEPIMHVSCRDRNRMALQSDLLGAAFLKIRNILCISGDHVSFGDHTDAMPVHDIDSVQLVEAIRGLVQGQDMTGHPLQGMPEFCVGAVANPEADPLQPQLFKFQKKIQSGVDFVVTHPVFNVDNLKPFLKEAREKKVKLLAGVRLLVSDEVPAYRDGSRPGLFVPENILAEIEGSGIDKGVEVAVRLIKSMKEKNLCDGVHISAPGHEEKIIDIIKAAGI